ncbi:hypothetical protein Bp8pS_291 [Bacillus phage vB_BpuM-BpSp]|nr:hypothetical protein Bp8pS_291 [Bacillus phage vB_BpuM-BpSp]
MIKIFYSNIISNTINGITYYILLRKVIGMKVNIDELKRLIKEHPDWTQKELAEELNISRSYIVYLFNKYDISYHKKRIYVKRNIDKLKNLIEEHPNWTQEKLAETLNVSSKTIGRLIREYNLSYERKYYRKGESIYLDKLKKLIEEHPNWTQKELAEELNISQTHINKLIKNHKIPYKQKKRKASYLDKLKKLIEEHPDWSQMKLAKELNIHNATVGRLIKKYNLKYIKK